jgi:hypothetical protein
MGTCKLIDTFPAFLTYWTKAREKHLDDQIESWATDYMAPWPELLRKQIEDYSGQHLDWQQVAREKVFPYLEERLPQMHQAQQNLLALSEPIYAKAQQALGFDSQAIFFIYVGIGCGAGWATMLGRTPSVLFGLENIAESGWSSPEALKGLIAHESAHLAHHIWRRQHGKSIGSEAWWQLYEEGVAEYGESLIINSATRHHTSGGQSDWLDWCRMHKQWLAAKFLQTVDAGKPVTPFFGSWYDICGRSETGYFLGYEAIEAMARRLTLREIALLDDPGLHLRPILEEWISAGEQSRSGE